jgi:hypothetical protein
VDVGRCPRRGAGSHSDGRNFRSLCSRRHILSILHSGSWCVHRSGRRYQLRNNRVVRTLFIVIVIVAVGLLRVGRILQLEGAQLFCVVLGVFLGPDVAEDFVHRTHHAGRLFACGEDLRLGLLGRFDLRGDRHRGGVGH